ncbi:MAG: SAM-dependent methyltransferase [Oxalobacteraceae bacterium]|nr:SAM-dependent methyltransferase [Oxalobacteraceae bacterium]
MHANSRPVTSSQTEAHAHLPHLIARHLASPYLKPVMPYNRAAFDLFAQQWRSAGEPPLILDAGCGVGLSTYHLAAQSPDSFVVGVDQSADRIDRKTQWPGPPPPNALLLRAELADFWRLLGDAGIPLSRHYLLYPNPWPKIGHLGRRWHGHPAFPAAVALGGVIECRSNWPVYVEEFALALRQLGVTDVIVEPFAPVTPITPFEIKYLASGHPLWRCHAQIRANVIAGIKQ